MGKVYKMVGIQGPLELIENQVNELAKQGFRVVQTVMYAIILEKEVQDDGEDQMFKGVGVVKKP